MDVTIGLTGDMLKCMTKNTQITVQLNVFKTMVRVKFTKFFTSTDIWFMKWDVMLNFAYS